MNQENFLLFKNTFKPHILLLSLSHTQKLLSIRKSEEMLQILQPKLQFKRSHINTTLHFVKIHYFSMTQYLKSMERIQNSAK
jgi:hypothetical protein